MFLKIIAKTILKYKTNFKGAFKDIKDFNINRIC